MEIKSTFGQIPWSKIDFFVISVKKLLGLFLIVIGIILGVWLPAAAAHLQLLL